jgi:predicted TIM-barrel fold metal-dependent hydrolase
MGRKYQNISGDGHLEVPPEYWVKYAPAKLREKAPHTVKLWDGTEVVRMGNHEMTIDVILAGDLDYDLYGHGNASKYHYDDGSARPGAGDYIQRLVEQDTDGIDAEILYPAVSAQRFLKNLINVDKDRNTYLTLVEAYNTWLGQEFCAPAPDRLIGNAIVPETNVEDAIREMERCKKMGIPSVNIANWPNGTGWYAPGDEKFFQAAADMKVLISPHSNFGAAAAPAGVSNKTTKDVARLNSRTGGSAAYATSQLIYHIFDKVPNSLIYIGESYCSWIPFNMNRQNEYYIRYQHREEFHLKKLPSEYYRDNMKFSFIHERSAMQMRYHIGLDLMLWGSDFPHTANTYPHSMESLDEMFLDVPAEERRRVMVLTPCEMVGLDPEKDITPTPKRK